ncbi:MAG: DMT family transporter [Acidobacteria bacterium]|nr:DMT family transporter [Acidobacteriota bacterium]
MSRSLKAHVLLVLVTAVWGGTFVLVKQALQDASALLLNTLRMTLASAALILMFRGRLRGLRKSFGPGVLVGLFLYAGYEFQTSGLRFTSPSKSAFITGLSVVLVPVIMAVGFHRRASFWTWAGVLLAFCGLFLMTVPAGQGWSAINRGDLLTLACAVAFAFQIIFVGRATSHESSACPYEQIAFLQTATAAVLMAISFPLLETPHVLWSRAVVTAVLVTGLLGTAAAFTIQAWAQQFLPATHTALILVLEPVFTWIASYTFMGEKVGSRSAVGAGLILGGILLGELVGARRESGISAPGAHPPTFPAT